MTQHTTSTRPKFKLGRLVSTHGAIGALQRAGQDPLQFIERHRRADYGDVDAGDAKLNDEAIAHEGNEERQSRVLSAYTLNTGEKIWIITEADRSSTCVLLPDDY